MTALGQALGRAAAPRPLALRAGAGALGQLGPNPRAAVARTGSRPRLAAAAPKLKRASWPWATVAARSGSGGSGGGGDAYFQAPPVWTATDESEMGKFIRCWQDWRSGGRIHLAHIHNLRFDTLTPRDGPPLPERELAIEREQLLIFELQLEHLERWWLARPRRFIHDPHPPAPNVTQRFLMGTRDLSWWLRGRAARADAVRGAYGLKRFDSLSQQPMEERRGLAVMEHIFAATTVGSLDGYHGGGRVPVDHHDYASRTAQHN